ncbi:MAG TPA: phospholipase D family protein [Nocardioidaceae bacterium]|nr:phospholipase D family protein [Nocardioidaceae bacterium]
MTDADWLLTADERGNAATGIDAGRDGGEGWSRGNQVRPLIHGATYFRRLLEELRDCREGDQVYVAAWRGDPAQRLDGPGTAAVVELGRAASAGVSVYGLVWRSHLDTVQRQARENKDFVKILRQLGGHVMVDQRVRKGGSHHQKFVVIRRPDRPASDVAFVGGIDLSFSRRDDSAHRGDPQPRQMAAAYGATPAWHDAHLEIHGPAVTDVEHCFRERWDDPTAVRHLPWLWVRDRVRSRITGPTRLPRALPPPAECGPHAVQLLRTYPDKVIAYPFAPHGERSVARGYQKALANARRLIYVEDQFLWSPLVAEVFARALRDQPRLRMVAVVPTHPDSDGRMAVQASDRAQRRALQTLYAAGGDRVDVYSPENHEGLPVYVHAKVCVIDDVWAAVGSANANRRSWTHDSELTAAVLDQTPDDRNGSRAGGAQRARTFARDLRLELWREHLDRTDGADDDLVDPDQAVEMVRRAAHALDVWHAAGRTGPRPPGRLRPHLTPAVAPAARWWAPVAAGLLFDPDGRSPRAIIRHRW